MYGTLSADAEVSIVEGEPGEGRFVARYRRDGEITGVLGWNMPKPARVHSTVTDLARLRGLSMS